MLITKAIKMVEWMYMYTVTLFLGFLNLSQHIVNYMYNCTTTQIYTY